MDCAIPNSPFLIDAARHPADAMPMQNTQKTAVDFALQTNCFLYLGFAEKLYSLLVLTQLELYLQ